MNVLNAPLSFIFLAVWRKSNNLLIVDKTPSAAHADHQKMIGLNASIGMIDLESFKFITYASEAIAKVRNRLIENDN